MAKHASIPLPRIRSLYMALLLLILALLSPALMPAASAGASGDWSTDASYSIYYLGRDGPNGSDHYMATIHGGGTFFAIGAQSLPLVPTDQAVNIVLDGFKSTFPGRDLISVQVGDSFDFFVPRGTVVSTQWRRNPDTLEYRSLRGDDLLLYLNAAGPIRYKLTRVESPGQTEVAINQDAELSAYDLAKTLYGPEDPGFKPDFLEVERAKRIIQNKTETVTLDNSRTHLDDFTQVRGQGQPGGKSPDGLDIYWFRSNQVAQQLFRIDDGIGDGTDVSAFPSPMRVYYYKDGTVRTYQRESDTLFLSGRQPKNEAWAKVFADYLKNGNLPNKWELGQAETDASAQEMRNLGIIVLRYQPKEPPKSNLFTQILDFLMSLMNRKSS